MVARRLGVLVGVLGVVAVSAVAAGCTAGVGTDGSQEKVGTTTEKLIQTDPTPPVAFPNGAIPTSCQRHAPTETVQAGYAGSPSWSYAENYIAFPVLDTTDTYRTAYTHGYQFADCSVYGTKTSCALETDFFGIPNANGFKYKIASLAYDAGFKTLKQGRQQWFLEGVNRADQSWEMYPWNAGGNGIIPWCTNAVCPANVAYYDGNSHPPYGADAKSADWAELWNLTWTYSYPNGPNGNLTSNVESTLHECAFVYTCPGGTRECASDSDCPGGQACYPDIGDRGMTCWASCYNPSTGTLDNNPKALVTQDFFVAADRHDPQGPPW
jgi:hypothetical protein